MTPAETVALVRLVVVAHDREIPDGLPEIWHATVGHLPFGLARRAVLEILQASPFLPRPADILERARLIDAQDKRDNGKRRQLVEREQRAITASDTATRARDGANMVRHVLGRLADAGQDVAAGKFLGVDRASAVSEAAIDEWRERMSYAEPTA